MTSNELRQKFLDFFAKRDHKIIPSTPLTPNDPTTLFVSAGMQPMLPYLLGEKSPFGPRVVDSQKCIRTGDSEEVGDNRHQTCFEMLGNWSFGDYFKKEQLPWIFEFLTQEAGLDPKRIYVTVFAGDEKYNLSKDTESPDSSNLGIFAPTTAGGSASLFGGSISLICALISLGGLETGIG